MWSSKDEDAPQDSLNTVMVLAQKLKLSKPETSVCMYNSFCCGDMKKTSSPRDDKNSSQSSKQSVWRFNRGKTTSETFVQSNGIGDHSHRDTEGVNGGLSPILKTRSQINQQRNPLKSQTAIDIGSDIDETTSSNDSDFSDIYTSDDCCKEPPPHVDQCPGYNSSNVDNAFVNKSHVVYTKEPVDTAVEKDANENIDTHRKEDTKISVAKDKQTCARRDISREQISSDNSQVFTVQTNPKPVNLIEKNNEDSFTNKQTTRAFSASKESTSFLQPCSSKQKIQIDRRDLESKDTKESSGIKDDNSNSRVHRLTVDKNQLNSKEINSSFEDESPSLDKTETDKQMLSINKCNDFIRNNYFSEASGTLPKDSEINNSERKRSENNSHDFGQKLNILQGELVQLRQHDEQLATQFLQIYRDIQILKVQRACQTHQDLLDDAIDEVEERDRLIDLCDAPPLKYSESKLRHCGLTKMNICSRRFSCS
ncbi:uncharacterized protein LOC106868230 [Octopus bimaculoides]|uniref:Uncharacterized protein n=1 Tax=Octopus bimaculoides TaxID=37653 RepID=A0A0L8HWA0_OCTBM|nr:uncharacterized protein LOC106868230 [Octopus bimaculoides]XP_014768883.1 uncharacterized protein LOC106868230 [Octopus bimaculoides]|eukprot:XP_014768882.1 PREDICTED: uncharacterized protein LOC106868230 [Octopus bimaculoides]